MKTLIYTFANSQRHPDLPPVALQHPLGRTHAAEEVVTIGCLLMRPNNLCMVSQQSLCTSAGKIADKRRDGAHQQGNGLLIGQFEGDVNDRHAGPARGDLCLVRDAKQAHNFGDAFVRHRHRDAMSCAPPPPLSSCLQLSRQLYVQA